MKLILDGDVPDPAERRPGYPPALAAIVRRALARDRERALPDGAARSSTISTRLARAAAGRCRCVGGRRRSCACARHRAATRQARCRRVRSRDARALRARARRAVPALKAIGAGGSARVDLARIERAYGFQRHVVIKRPLEHLRGDARAAESLRREARLGGRLATRTSSRCSTRARTTATTTSPSSTCTAPRCAR